VGRQVVSPQQTGQPGRQGGLGGPGGTQQQTQPQTGPRR
jgi:hypothetical protein